MRRIFQLLIRNLQWKVGVLEGWKAYFMFSPEENRDSHYSIHPSLQINIDNYTDKFKRTLNVISIAIKNN